MQEVFEKIIEKLEEKEKYIKELLQEVCFDVRSKHGDDCVCGLCEYDGAYIGESGDWYNECPGFDSDECFKLSTEMNTKLNITEIVKQAAIEYNNGWIPCNKELPPQPAENPLFDSKQLELYLVSVKDDKYPFRAFWNGKSFTDGWSKINVIAWQPLPEPYQPKGE